MVLPVLSLNVSQCRDFNAGLARACHRSELRHEHEIARRRHTDGVLVLMKLQFIFSRNMAFRSEPEAEDSKKIVRIGTERGSNDW